MTFQKMVKTHDTGSIGSIEIFPRSHSKRYPIQPNSNHYSILLIYSSCMTPSTWIKESHESKNEMPLTHSGIKIPAQKVTNHSLPRGIETFIDLSKLDNARPIEVGFCGAIGLTQHKAEIWTCDRSRLLAGSMKKVIKPLLTRKSTTNYSWFLLQ